jgi:hypothetical protein
MTGSHPLRKERNSKFRSLFDAANVNQPYSALPQKELAIKL